MTDASAGVRRWGEKVQMEMLKAMQRAGNTIECESVIRCPKDTGELRRNHTVIIQEDEGQITAHVAYETNVPPEKQYGLQVHECPDSALAYSRNVSLKKYRHGKQNRGVPWDIGEDHFLAHAVEAKRGEVEELLKTAMEKCCK